MPISEDVDFGLVLNDSKIRIKTALDKIVIRVRVNYSNEVIAKIKTRTPCRILCDSYGCDYWAIVERIPVRFLNFTLWHKDRILISTNHSTIYNGGFMSWDIYERKIADIAMDEINKLFAHYPRCRVNITKHFRPICTEPGHLIAGDALL